MIALRSHTTACFVIAVSALNLASAHDTSRGGHSGPVMNYHIIDDSLATGGHLNDGGLEYFVDDGVQLIIDLRDEPPEAQMERVASQGIEWINVPIVWKDPRAEDFAKFKAAMLANKGAKTLVQCQANYRASAMTYLYRVTVLGVPAVEAEKDLHAIWTPNSQWQAYIDSVIEAEAQ